MDCVGTFAFAAGPPFNHAQEDEMTEDSQETSVISGVSADIKAIP